MFWFGFVGPGSDEWSSLAVWVADKGGNVDSRFEEFSSTAIEETGEQADWAVGGPIFVRACLCEPSSTFIDGICPSGRN